MLNIGSFHPQIVHFVIALLFVGVGARVLSFLPLPPYFAFLSPAGFVLIVMGSVAAVAAAESGDETHELSEQIPGVRPAVQEHERWGERTRNMFIAVGLLEIAAVVLRTRPAARRIRAVSAVAGVVGLFILYEAGEHGGELVYSYAGGVGTRTGDTADVTHALRASLFNASVKERDAGHPVEAARLVGELARQMPGDTSVRFLVVESRLHDAHDPAAAVALLDSIGIAPADRRNQSRAGALRAEALVTAGKPDSARAVITTLLARYPGDRRLQQQLDRLK